MECSFFRPILALIVVSALGGRGQGVLDPRGPIASAQRIILFDSLGIIDETLSGLRACLIGLVVAVVLTATTFRAANRSLLWATGITTGRAVLAIAPDGRSPRLLPAHHNRSRQYQQRIGAGIRRGHRHPWSSQARSGLWSTRTPTRCH